MTVVGIDLAAAAKKTYACVLEAHAGRLCAKVVAGCDDDALLELARGSDKGGDRCSFRLVHRAVVTFCPWLSAVDLSDPREAVCSPWRPLIRQ